MRELLLAAAEVVEVVSLEPPLFLSGALAAEEEAVGDLALQTLVAARVDQPQQVALRVALAHSHLKALEALAELALAAQEGTAVLAAAGVPLGLREQTLLAQFPEQLQVVPLVKLLAEILTSPILQQEQGWGQSYDKNNLYL